MEHSGPVRNHARRVVLVFTTIGCTFAAGSAICPEATASLVSGAVYWPLLIAMALAIVCAPIALGTALAVTVWRRLADSIDTEPAANLAERDRATSEVRALSEQAVRAVSARHLARLAFGLMMLTGAGVLVCRVAAGDRTHTRETIAATWGSAFVVALIAGAIGRVGSMRLSPRTFRLSLTVPSAGMALLLPLTLHGLVFWLFGLSAHAFDEWVTVTMFAVGLTHVAFAVMVWIRGSRLADGRPPQSLRSIFAVAVGLSAIPFGFYYGIPMVLAAITGLPILLLLRLVDHRDTAERPIVMAFNGLPRAMLMSPR